MASGGRRVPEPRAGRAKARQPPHLLRRPEGRLGLLVHLPDVVVLDGEDDEPAGVLPQQRLLLLRVPGHLEQRRAARVRPGGLRPRRVAEGRQIAAEEGKERGAGAAPGGDERARTRGRGRDHPRGRGQQSGGYRGEERRSGARAFRTHRPPVALLEDLAGRLAGQDAGAAERGGLQGERGRVRALRRSRARNGTEGGRAPTVFSLSLSARSFRGDRPFLGDTRGWSWRGASGTRADSMVTVRAAAERAALTGGRAAPAPLLYISFELGARTLG